MNHIRNLWDFGTVLVTYCTAPQQTVEPALPSSGSDMQSPFRYCNAPQCIAHWCHTAYNLPLHRLADYLQSGTPAEYSLVYYTNYTFTTDMLQNACVKRSMLGPMISLQGQPCLL